MREKIVSEEVIFVSGWDARAADRAIQCAVQAARARGELNGMSLVVGINDQ